MVDLILLFSLHNKETGTSSFLKQELNYNDNNDNDNNKQIT